jgi:hypothetical protein
MVIGTRGKKGTNGLWIQVKCEQGLPAKTQSICLWFSTLHWLESLVGPISGIFYLPTYLPTYIPTLLYDLPMLLYNLPSESKGAHFLVKVLGFDSKKVKVKVVVLLPENHSRPL